MLALLRSRGMTHLPSGIDCYLPDHGRKSRLILKGQWEDSKGFIIMWSWIHTADTQISPLSLILSSRHSDLSWRKLGVDMDILRNSSMMEVHHIILINRKDTSGR